MTAPPPIRALVVDDEPLARLDLRSLIEQRPGWIWAGEAGSGHAAAAGIERARPDVVFLDIRMPGPSGLRVARSLAAVEPRPLVVFVTAFEQHALEAFEVEAADYLVKPLDRARFVTAVGRLERRLRPPPAAAATTEVARPAAPLGSLAVKSVGRVRLVEVADIQWIGAAGNYVRLYLADACYLHRATLASLERDLDPSRFLRIHRSTLVNRGEVTELRTSVVGRHQLVLRDGTELEISQRFKQRVFAALVPAG